jgi:hypothetical protein
MGDHALYTIRYRLKSRRPTTSAVESTNHVASAMSPFLKGLGLTVDWGACALFHTVAVIGLETRSDATWPTVLTISLALSGSLSV